MKPEAAAFLDKAREALAKAEGMLDRWPDEAGREAYLAGLLAAQALIVERTGAIIKRHRGVQRELGRVKKDDARVDMELRAFLGRTYQLKAIADCLTGPGSQVSPELATEAIATAGRFVAMMARCREPSKLRAWGGAIARRRGAKRVRVVIARKLAVIMHRMWISGCRFATGVDVRKAAVAQAAPTSAQPARPRPGRRDRPVRHAPSERPMGAERAQ